MKKGFWKSLWCEIKKRAIGSLVTVLLIVVCGLIGFGWRTYQTVDKVVPALQDTVKNLKDTISALDKSPIQIKEDMEKIKNEQRAIKMEQQNQKEDIEEIKDYQKLILQKLIEMDGD